MGITTVTFLFLGCQSAAKRAQGLYEQGKYEEVIEKYQDNPDAAGVVEAAKSVIGDELLRQRKYDEYLELWDNTRLSDSAKSVVARELAKRQSNQGSGDLSGDTSSSPQPEIAIGKVRGDSVSADPPKSGK